MRLPATYTKRRFVGYWTRDRIMNLLIGCVIAVCLVLLIRYLRNVLLPFFVACLIAYLLNPLVLLNKKLLRCKGRALAALLAIIEVVAVFTALVYVFLPSTVDQINEMGAILTRFSKEGTLIPNMPREISEFLRKNFDISSFSDLLSQVKLPTIMEKGGSVVAALISVIGDIVEWLLMFIYIIFISIDYDQIGRGIKLIFPAKHRDKGVEILDDVKNSMNHYFRGQGLVALCAMILYCIGFSIAGLPLAIPLGLLVGLLYMIPYFQYITVIPVIIVSFIYSLAGQFNFWAEIGYCGLVYVVSQSICDYIITPHIMGRELNMNPAVILLSLSIWGSLMGIIGMIIALPVTSLIMAYYERYISDPQPGNNGRDAGTPSSGTSDVAVVEGSDAAPQSLTDARTTSI